jgi:hypothetical protein
VSRCTTRLCTECKSRVKPTIFILNANNLKCKGKQYLYLSSVNIYEAESVSNKIWTDVCLSVCLSVASFPVSSGITLYSYYVYQPVHKFSTQQWLWSIVLRGKYEYICISSDLIVLIICSNIYIYKVIATLCIRIEREITSFSWH